MLRFLRTTRGRIVIAFVASTALAVLWVDFEMPIAILPALMIPFWIPLFARQEEPVSPRTRRFMLASIVVGAAVFAVGVLIYMFVVQS